MNPVPNKKIMWPYCVLFFLVGDIVCLINKEAVCFVEKYLYMSVLH